MGTSSSSMLSLLSIILLLSLSWAASDSVHGAFLQCLSSHSQPSHPISAVIYTPDNSSYSSVLESYIRNLRFNTPATPKPCLIITATHESHIQAAVICSKKHGLEIKIRSGGHDYEGMSYVSDAPFFILDIKYGLSVDNIVDAELVDVNGRLLNRKSMGEDLFWAIRGGGGASYGVIVSYKIKLVQVPATVTVFRVARTLEQNATNIVYKWQQIADKVDEDLFIRLILDVVNDSRRRVYGIKYFKKNFNRLVHIKTKVDPGNFFRNEQSIPTLPYEILVYLVLEVVISIFFFFGSLYESIW
ncbi:unnamed protein product, partial [Vitis vinifera]